MAQKSDFAEMSAWVLADLHDLGHELASLPEHNDAMAARAMFWDVARALERYQEMLLGLLLAQEMEEVEDGGDGNGG